MGRVVGIDLGTSTSEIAVMQDGKPLVIPNKYDQKITPSVVGILENGQMVVGKDAWDQMLLRPYDTVLEVKRLMGTSQKVSMEGKEYTPQEISSFILKHLKEYAGIYLGEEVERAVITVPAYFTDEQRRATVEAGRLAGLKVERIINEPTAAALAYGIEHMEENSHVLVYDLGGGTLDVTVLEMFEGVLEVKASSGNNRLGGKDFDERLMDVLTDAFSDQYGIELSKNLGAMSRIKQEAEKCKIALSTQDTYEVILPFIAERDGNPVALHYTFTKAAFEALIEDLVESTREPIEIALKDAGLTANEIDIALLVGGSTRIPMISSFLEEVLGKAPHSLVDPDLAVVIGAAVQGAIINEELSSQQDILITDVCPYTLGIETLGYMAGIPVPDLYDVIIPRNTTIPVTREKVYGTVVDNQSKVEVKVYQGDRKRASANNPLGNFILEGIPEAPAFEQKIKVRFTYDINGILQVEAIIASTGKQATITIETTGVEMEKEIDVSGWKDAPGARKYRPLIRRAERILKEDEDLSVESELADLVLELKKGLVSQQDEEELEEISEQINDLLYEMGEEE